MLVSLSWGGFLSAGVLKGYEGGWVSLCRGAEGGYEGRCICSWTPIERRVQCGVGSHDNHKTKHDIVQCVELKDAC